MTGAALGWLPWCRAGIDVSSDRCLPIARALTSSFKVLLSGEARNGYQASSVGLLRLQKLFELLEQGKIAPWTRLRLPIKGIRSRGLSPF